MVPKAQVIMAARDAGAFIDEAIASVRAQTFEAFRLAVVVNGSTDDTYAIAAKHAAADPRVEVSVVDAVNAADARNQATYCAPYFCALDADDALPPNFLEELVGALDQEPPSTVAAYGEMLMCFEATGAEVDDRADRQNRLGVDVPAEGSYIDFDDCVVGAFPPDTLGTLLFRRESIPPPHYFDATFDQAEGMELTYRLLRHDPAYRLLSVPTTYLRYRKHAGQTMHTRRQRDFAIATLTDGMMKDVTPARRHEAYGTLAILARGHGNLDLSVRHAECAARLSEDPFAELPALPAFDQPVSRSDAAAGEPHAIERAMPRRVSEGG
jgi:glycosyltransferase involved in cell wall biosynthesis